MFVMILGQKIKKSAVFFVAVFWFAAVALGSSAENNAQTRSVELSKAEKARNIERLTADFERLGQLYIKRKSDDYLNFVEEKFWSDKCPLTHRKMMYLAVVCGANWVKSNRNEFPEGYGNYFALPFVNPRRNNLMANALLEKVEDSLRGSPEKFAYLLKIYAKDPYYDGTQWYFYGGVLKYIKEKYARYKKYLPSGARYREVALELGMSHLGDMGEFIDEPLEFQKELFKRRVMKLYGSDFKEGYTEYSSVNVFGEYTPEIYQNGWWRMKEVMHFGGKTVKNRCLSGNEPFEVEYENPAYDWNKAIKILDDFEKKYAAYPFMISYVYNNGLRWNSFESSGPYTKTVYSGKIVEELKFRREKFFKISKSENAKNDNGDEVENGRK